MLATLTLGVVAGLGVAVPLGAVGVLLVHEGMSRGRRTALLAATGVAVVDLAYAAAALVVGSAVAAVLQQWQGVVRMVGAAVLAAVALHGLLGVRSRSGAPEPARRRPPGGAFWRFVALTALNPLTVVYFTVVAAGLGERLRGSAGGVPFLPALAFLLGVFAASWAWQAGLGLAGAAAGRRLPGRFREVTHVLGSTVVLALAVALALSA